MCVRERERETDYVCESVPECVRNLCVCLRKRETEKQRERCVCVCVCLSEKERFRQGRISNRLICKAGILRRKESTS